MCQKKQRTFGYMKLAMICAKIGLDLSKVEKNMKKHAFFCSILTFLLIFQFQQNFSAKHCKINISYTFLVLLTPLSPLYLLKQWQKKSRDISVSVVSILGILENPVNGVTIYLSPGREAKLQQGYQISLSRGRLSKQTDKLAWQVNFSDL